MDFSHLKGLKGISDGQIETQIADDQTGTPAWAEANRHAGWEYNGMRLHEYYFGNLHPGGKGDPGPKFKKAVEASFGSFEAWRKDFTACGSMRGIGWTILYRDPMTGAVSNHWITEHDVGHPAGFTPILILDVFEHAFMVDYKVSERGKYIEAYFENVNWDEAEIRLA